MFAKRFNDIKFVSTFFFYLLKFNKNLKINGFLIIITIIRKETKETKKLFYNLKSNRTLHDFLIDKRV